MVRVRVRVRGELEWARVTDLVGGLGDVLLALGEQRAHALEHPVRDEGDHGGGEGGGLGDGIGELLGGGVVRVAHTLVQRARELGLREGDDELKHGADGHHEQHRDHAEHAHAPAVRLLHG